MAPSIILIEVLPDLDDLQSIVVLAQVERHKLREFALCTRQVVK